MNATTDSCGGLLLCATSRPVFPSLSVACVSQPASMSGCRQEARPWSHAQSHAGMSNSLSTAPARPNKTDNSVYPSAREIVSCEGLTCGWRTCFCAVLQQEFQAASRMLCAICCGELHAHTQRDGVFGQIKATQLCSRTRLGCDICATATYQQCRPAILITRLTVSSVLQQKLDLFHQATLSA